jgi:hypothetical protein
MKRYSVAGRSRRVTCSAAAKTVSTERPVVAAILPRVTYRGNISAGLWGSAEAGLWMSHAGLVAPSIMALR